MDPHICCHADDEGGHLLLTRAEWRAKEAKVNGYSRKSDKKKVKCFKCRNFGHYTYDCNLGEERREDIYCREARRR